MSKSDVVRELSIYTGLKSVDSEKALRGIGFAITRLLKQGQAVKIPGVGVLTPVVRQARKGRNPQTGESIEIPSRNDVKFKASVDLKEAL